MRCEARTDPTEVVGKLAAIAGGQSVAVTTPLLEGYREAGFVSGGKPLAIFRPKHVDHVKAVIELARREKVNLVFTSSAPPHFRGSTVPCGEGVIIDMSGMSRVVRIDTRNKVALIEPGVTFAGLAAEADKAGLKVLMPLLPRRGKSVLASYLEREPIQIPKYHWDATDPLLCTELVFGTGDVFRTGSAAGPGSLEKQWAAGDAQKNPMGPGQTDFVRLVQGAQGTLAAVTWASVKLEVKPRVHRLHFVPHESLDRLIAFAYRALRVKLGDEFFIVNARTLSTMLSSEPAEIDRLAGVQAPYTLVYGVSGYRHFPEQRAAYQERDLAEIARAAGVEAVRALPACSAERMEAILARPSEDPYYKLTPEGAFLDIFFLTTLNQAPRLIEVMVEVAKKHDYPISRLGTYIQPIQQGRTIHLEFTLYYDPSDERVTNEVRALFAEAITSLSQAGAFFSRPYGPWAEIAYARCPDTVAALGKIKAMLDPDGIMNGGKLCFPEAL